MKAVIGGHVYSPASVAHMGEGEYYLISDFEALQMRAEDKADKILKQEMGIGPGADRLPSRR